MSTITATDLASALTGNPEALEVHLTLVERDVVIAGHLVKIHCHCLTVDGNGRVQPYRLAEFMRNAAVDYAIPRSKVAHAKARDNKFNSTEAVAELIAQAKRTFTDLAKSGEGGVKRADFETLTIATRNRPIARAEQLFDLEFAGSTEGLVEICFSTSWLGDH
ncbi:DUF1837 domain-containing protein [Dechloromonas denitrificans]|uniref:DUF1837 domain-containing protein n=1 Tax=Dechloromonas denitrificans TaxID=281362 RepID=UPI001CF9EF0E|nr:DUF1837 domain-containing protein [Dechloromonas denitrificans]UCV09427.1 hypothetical protein KI615_07905 [Dechloromonas denitrificans]